ncbi:MAG: hypothetical protein HFE68_04110 [Erysipelotrichaceae bacterium]|nr:hypothetical protein [Erysipelotrichaceae bacterium]
MENLAYSILAVAFLLIAIVGYGCILEKLKKNPGFNFYTAILVACVFLLIFLVLNAIYGLSALVFEGFQEEPYKLEFKDCVNTVTQVLTFIVTTGLAIVPFIFSKYKDIKDKQKETTESTEPSKD